MYGATRVNTIDLNDNKNIGFGFPFNVPGIFKQTSLSKDSIKANLINYFLTNPGERYMNPEFGAGLREFVFEHLSNRNISTIESHIIRHLELYFPDLTIAELNFNPDYDRNQLLIELTYIYTITGDKDTVFINL